MNSDDLDIEPAGDSLDGTDPKDPDMYAAADSIGDTVKARRPKAPKHQGRRGRTSGRSADRTPRSDR
jgi:hypothetical protein